MQKRWGEGLCHLPARMTKGDWTAAVTGQVDAEKGPRWLGRQSESPSRKGGLPVAQAVQGQAWEWRTRG